MWAGKQVRETKWLVLVLGASLFATTPLAQARQIRGQRGGAAAPKPRVNDFDVPPVVPTNIPVNPNDAIAVVNGQPITRQQLADECVIREGPKILDTLINRALIEQALKGRKLEVTGAEIEQEIESVAARFGISREAWLRTLDKEKKISPMQYARDIIQPALALRKLCAGRVQVTPKDLKDAFEAQFGDKLRCRMILLDKQANAIEIWEELKKNPGGFEKLAQERSIDSGSRALGGLVAEPITRHAYPQNVSDAAFQQLVDGDPKDRDPSHKPKDGDFTGPIQIAETAWVLLRRESVVPAVKGADLRDERVKKQTYDMIYEVKLKEAMGLVFQEIVKASSIENRLTGAVKLANDDRSNEYKKAEADVHEEAGNVQGSVKLMSDPNAELPLKDAAAAPKGTVAPDDAAVSRTKIPTPAALSPEAAAEFNRISPKSKNAGSATPAPSGTAPAPSAGAGSPN